MATSQSERDRQAAEAGQVYHYALAYLGYASIQEAMSSWASANPSSPDLSGLLDAMLELIFTRRSRARELTIAYYRLVRAYRTGTTVPAPGAPSDEAVTLTSLRREFRLLAEESMPERVEPPTERTRRPYERARLEDAPPPLPADDEGGDQPIELDDEDGGDIDWGEEDSPELEEIVEAEIIDALRVFEKKRAARERAETGEQAVAIEKEADRSTSGRIGGVGQRGVLDAARAPLYLAGGSDAKVIGWVRLSRSGTPCHFCAMQISRGLIFKRSQVERDGVERTGIGVEPDAPTELFHENCQCYSEPVFSTGQWQNDDRFALNKEMQALWNEHIKGKYSGEEAINAWRRLLRERRAKELAEEIETDAQAA